MRAHAEHGYEVSRRVGRSLAKKHQRPVRLANRPLGFMSSRSCDLAMVQTSCSRPGRKPPGARGTAGRGAAARNADVAGADISAKGWQWQQCSLQQPQQAGAQHLGASQQAGAQQAFSQHAWQQQPSLAFSSANRQQWHFGAHSQPQAGVQAGAQAAGRKPEHRVPEAQHFGASQQAGRSTPGAQQHFSRRQWQQASLARSRSFRHAWQQLPPQQAGSQHLGASQQAGAQALGASQQAGAQQHFAQRQWQQANLA